ncbi:capsule biosynthesis protein [Nioella sp. MMSF_3534]|uniref:capsule biosynthesis protein n=2 Tax=Nioella TaxID=1775424 RepID=UPI0008FD52E2|nr:MULTISPECIES: capsule biosynthesis protein [Nioella]TBX28311.1 capsule biosynthesis protein [Roseovarius sp. JS7-11]
MTMKPRGKKFRIRRTGPTAPAGETRRVADDSLDAPTDDGFGNMRFPTAGAPAGQSASPQQPAQRQTQGMSIEEELAAIRSEGLTGRQLRMARRTAQKHGLQPASDFDAVRLLRRQGIDPFERSNMLELVVNDGQQRAEAQPRLPATVRQPNVPAAAPQTAPAMAPPTLDDAARAQEILRMQRDIAARRRKRLLLLFARLMAFVMLPTMLVGYYYYNVATPMYATTTLFQIQKAESASPAGGLGGLLGGTTFATVQDSIAVQSFLESREAMLLLDEELGLREHFSAPDIDPLNRLAPDASTEDLYALYSRNLTIGYDPTEGMVRMEVLAADPQLSAAFSQALLRYAEERVDQMSHRLRDDQMAGARESYDAAEDALASAQLRVVNLQEQTGILSSEAEVGALFNQISTFEIQLQNERLRLDELLSVDRPNQTRVEVAERNIARLEALIEELRSSMTEDASSQVSLARISSELAVAQADLQTRQLMLSQALQALEGARLEAERQSLYLTISVNPVAPDEAAFPRKLENTLLAFLIFSGIYLMLSMTASILREQVSA